MRITFLIALVSSASFTSSLDEMKLSHESFPEYLGDRNTLNRIIAISGTVAKRFPRDARYLDDILEDDHLIHMCGVLNESGRIQLGRIISELSPDRFDSLCFRLDQSQKTCLIDGIAKGYGNFGSRWKKASEIQEGTPVTPENAMFYPFKAEGLCNLMQSRPADILTIRCKNYCAKVWLQQGKHELIRKWILGSLDGRYLKKEVFHAFDGHQEELVEWLKFAIQGGFFEHEIQIYLPRILDLEHLKLLKDSIASKECTSSPYLSMDSPSKECQRVIEEIYNVVILKNTIITCDWTRDWTSIGFDHEPFMGKWPIAKSLNPHLRLLHRSYFQRGQGYPQMLDDAFSSALNFGDLEPLANALKLLSSLDPNANDSITENFWDWFEEEFDFSGAQPYLDKWRAIFGLLKKHLTLIKKPLEDYEADEAWHYVALYEDMLKSPSTYFPSHLEADAMAWLQSALKGFPVEPKKSNCFGDNSLFSYALHRGWTEVAKWAVSKHFSDDYLNSALFSQLSELYGREALRREFAPKLKMNLRKSLGWIALSSNYKLLDAFLDLYSPKYILSACEDPELQRRINLMLHLSPKTVSLKFNGEIVDKNSAFFRDWVMCRLFSNHPADLKLLDHYFTNRCNRQYPNFDLFSGNRVLGILGDYHVPHDPMSAMDLQFPIEETSGNTTCEVPDEEDLEVSEYSDSDEEDDEYSELRFLMGNLSFTPDK